MLCEMESVSSRIWTGVAMSISYNDNHYTTGTSKTGFVNLGMATSLEEGKLRIQTC